MAVVDWELIGQGYGLTGVVARLSVEYAQAIARVPRTFILKLPMASPESMSLYRAIQIRDEAAARQFYERCAREVRFYREIALESPVIAPKAYFAASDDEERSVVLLLEDLVAGRPGDVLAGCAVAEARDVLQLLSRFHARWWGRTETSATRFPWLPGWGGGYAARQRRYDDQVPRFLERWGASIPPEIVAIAQRLRSRYAALLEALDALPSTIIHADLHLDNLMFAMPDRQPSLAALDWQSVCRGPAIVDIGPFIAGSLQPDDRRRAEHSLLETYHAQLVANGIGDYSLARMQHDFALMLPCMLAGIIGWLANSDPDRLSGREQRLVEAALGDGRVISALLDHDVLQLLNTL